MPRPRFFKLSPEKQRRIIDVAKTEFAENGYRGASYNRIIENAGLSKGAMYYYFDDKTDLYATVLKDAQIAMAQHIGVLQMDEDFWTGVEVLIARAIEFSQSHPELAALARGLREAPRLGDDGPIGELYQMNREMLRGIVEQGQAAGAVRTDVPKSLLINIAMAMGEAIDF